MRIGIRFFGSCSITSTDAGSGNTRYGGCPSPHGQRKGLGVAAKHPLYVLELNPCRNEVVVGSADDTLQHELKLTDCTWITDEPFGEVQVKVRSASILRNAVFEGNMLVFPDGITAAAPGQSAVLYRDDEVLGGGIIKSAE